MPILNPETPHYARTPGQPVVKFLPTTGERLPLTEAEALADVARLERERRAVPE